MEQINTSLNNLNTFLIERFGEFGPHLVVGILGMFLILLTLPVLLRKQEDPLDKLRENNRAQTAAKSKNGQKLRTGGGKDKLEKYSNYLEPSDEEEY